MYKPALKLSFWLKHATEYLLIFFVLNTYSKGNTNENGRFRSGDMQYAVVKIVLSLVGTLIVVALVCYQLVKKDKE